MNGTFAFGVGLTILGVVGYVTGVTTAYPGRSFAVTAVMLGFTLAAIGRSSGPEGSA